jgi:thiol:disulfide interchange protein DsbA
MQGIIRWACAALLLVSAAVSAQGPGYSELKPARQPAQDGVEVREFFSYGCPHCFTFMPLFEAWKKTAPEQVKVVRTPVIFQESWKPLAEAYYVAESLGVLDKIHQPLFEAIHVKNRRFKTREDLVEFFVAQGVPRQQAADAFGSFRVDMLIRQSHQAMRDHRIDSTPTVVVNGKYVVSPRTAGGHQNMIQVIDQLVRQELSAKK